MSGSDGPVEDLEGCFCFVLEGNMLSDRTLQALRKVSLLGVHVMPSHYQVPYEGGGRGFGCSWEDCLFVAFCSQC